MTDCPCGKKGCEIEKGINPILACHKKHGTDVEIKLATPGYNHGVLEITNKETIAKNEETVMKPPGESISDLEERLKNIVHESSSVTTGSVIREKLVIVVPILAIIAGSIKLFSHFKR
jgi:hypothetical protein